MHLDHLPGTFFGPSNLVELLLHRARCQPNDVAFTYLVDGENEQVQLTYRELDRQARAIGAWLESHDLVGERALLLYPAGLEFIAAFFGCVYAGVIAVPVYPPRRNRSLNRIQAIADDAEARVALTTDQVLNRVLPLIDETPHLKQLTWLPTCQVPPEMDQDWTMPDVHGDTPIAQRHDVEKISADLARRLVAGMNAKLLVQKRARREQRFLQRTREREFARGAVLPFSQRVAAAFQLDRVADARGKLARIVGLAHVVERAGLETFFDVRDFVPRRDHDDRNFRGERIVFQLPADREAVNVRQLNIDQRDIRLPIARGGERAGTVLAFGNRAAQIGHDFTQQKAVERLVLHDEHVAAGGDFFACGIHGASAVR